PVKLCGYSLFSTAATFVAAAPISEALNHTPVFNTSTTRSRKNLFSPKPPSSPPPPHLGRIRVSE
ncbi:hypothetical protein, partial [Paracidovorax anthurii]|uniref:hypothetical protein n=1 Tax=Paracidovorax anthurii TaxID=78229 RepID=UPI0039F0A8D9